MWIHTQRISILHRNLSPRSTESLGTARSLKIHLVKTSTTFTCQTFTCASWTACRTVWITAICVDCDPKVHPMASQDVSVEDQVGMLKNPWTTQIELHLCTRLNPLGHPETWPWPSPAALYALFSWHAFWFCQQVPGHWSRWGGFGSGMKSRNCMKLLGPLGTRCSHSHRSGLQDPAQHGIEVLPEAEVDGMKIWADLVMGCHGWWNDHETKPCPARHETETIYSQARKQVGYTPAPAIALFTSPAWRFAQQFRRAQNPFKGPMWLNFY